MWAFIQSKKKLSLKGLERFKSCLMFSTFDRLRETIIQKELLVQEVHDVILEILAFTT